MRPPYWGILQNSMSPEEKRHKFRKGVETEKFYQQLAKEGFGPKITALSTIGYHGTSKKIADKVVRDFNLNPSALDGFPGKEAFLGEGRYLYENGATPECITGLQAAHDWAINKRHFADPAVVLAEIQFQKLFDLMEQDNAEFFQRVAFKIEKQQIVEESVKLTDWKILKYIVLSCPELANIDIDGVRWNGFSSPSFNQIGQLGVCVKEKSCIRKLVIAH